MTDKKTLLLVDGSSYLYRAFHAMPDLRAVPGDPSSPATGAIRGMINMMQKLRRDVRADYAACVFDAPGKTFRDDWYPDYKANRSPMPDDLRSQIDRSTRWCGCWAGRCCTCPAWRPTT
jgi:DNA polymerase-1